MGRMRTRSFIGPGVRENEPLCIPGLADRVPMETKMAIRYQQEERAVGYKIHPVANLFPEMTDAEFGRLCADIRANGQREPIVLFDGQVIDGRNRLRACRWLEFEPKTRTFHGNESDLLSYVVSLNLHRRHLTESQRAMVAEKIANTKHGGRRKGVQRDQGANLPLETTNAQAAELLNVSERSVKSATKVRKEAEPEVTAAVEAGEMSLNEASKVVQLKPAEQREIAGLPKSERRERLMDNSDEEMEIHRAADDPHGIEREGLFMALADLVKVKGSPEELILDMPKYSAPDLNKHFRQAFMRMQALHAVYQNWEYRNVHDD